jgi:sugar phosphate isomerase/epimerase
MKLAAQFYTLREHVKTASGLRTALQRVHEMGYEGVQISAVEAFEKEVSPEQLRDWLHEYNLVCCATHRPWDNLLNKTEAEIKLHKTIGCTHIGIGMGPKKCFDGGAPAWREWLKEAQHVIDAFGAEGLNFCYHNHAVEFEDKGGKKAYDIMLTEADPRLQFILDTYWIVHAGVDCADQVSKMKNRVNVVHLKDKAVVKGEIRMAPVGRGNLAWHKILPALDASGTQWGIVEQDDCYGEDPFECLRQSLAYLQQTKKV